MESRFLLLLIALVVTTLPGCSLFSQQNADANADDDGATPVVIDPDIDRREIKRARIDKENFEVSVYAGLMSIEDFGTSTVFGGRVAFHVTEDFFLEGAYGVTQGEETSFELLSGDAQLLTDEERDFTYYNASLGYNIFPGEAFLWRNRAFNTSLYVIAGVGSTEFAGDDRFTINVGAGFRLLMNDAFAVRLDVRDHLFDIDLLGTDKTAHNIEYHLGLSFFF
ncbi:MAG: outer membrane beta-barrel domain-containing protein [Gammaproteobacteria bacterium]